MTYGDLRRARPRMAFDRSLRSVDSDGHLVVEMSRISKACVNSYVGNEIPRWKELGLDPDRIYRLYRDPAELAKAASTFSGKPLLIRHVPVTADLPNQTLWVGTVGRVTFEAPYLVARPLTVIDGVARALVESDERRELSAGYRYVALMVPGRTPDGERFDGRMTRIEGNHVSIVSQGRAGADVLVADELPRSLRNTRNLTRPSTTSRRSAMPSPRRGLTAAQQNRLFQRAYGDPGYRDPMSHAMDADPDEAAANLRKAIAHMDAVESGASELDHPRLRGYLQRAHEALEDVDAEDDERDHEDEVTHADAHGGPTRVRAQGVADDHALDAGVFDADALFQR